MCSMKIYFSSEHNSPSTSTKDIGNAEHIQRLRSLGLAEEDIQVKELLI
jgi:hypothetical protein